MNPAFAPNRPKPPALTQIPNLPLSLDTLGNPEGIGSLSPGLRGTSYPGFEHRKTHQPCKGCCPAYES